MPNASAPENLQTERTKAAPAARIKVKIGDAEREIFMSFGRLNELVRYVGTAEGVPELYFNPDVSRAALETLLAPRDARGRIVEGEVALIPEELDLEVVDQLLELGAAERDVQVLRARRVGRDEGEVDVGRLGRRQLHLRLLRGLLEALERHRVLRQVDPLLALELLHELRAPRRLHSPGPPVRHHDASAAWDPSCREGTEAFSW